MPIYTYKDDETGAVYDVIQGMNDKHEFFINGKKLRRIFHVPQASIDTRVNPTDEKGFLEKTSKMKGTIGDMQDFSRELSEKRGGENDPVKQNYYKHYAKKRRGKEHPDVIKKKRQERLKNLETKMGIKVTD